MASLPFTGKVILITGAASGIGRATSILLSSLGASLALTDISPSSLASTLSLCTNPSEHISSTFSVVSASECNTFVSQIVSKYGHLDHVFNCAGVNPSSYPTSEVTDEYWDKIIGTNLSGTFNVCRATIPHLSPGSTMVNVSSILGLSPSAFYAPYSASKAAVIGFSKALALELGVKGVRVNVIAPGYIHTPSNAAVVDGAESVKQMEKNVALGRFGTAEEVAETVVWLMSEKAAYVSGSVVEIHGGLKL